jgi:uncharacterized membrane protein
MLKNKHFSFKRLFLLYRKGFIENRKKMILYTIGIPFGLILIIVLFMYLTTGSFNDFNKWSNKLELPIFFFLFLMAGMLYNSNAFAPFRSKEKSLSYLILPASTIEKFTFEFINKIVLFFIVFPFLFWGALNLIGICLHEIYPEFESYKFEFNSFYNILKKWNHYTILSIAMLFITIPFLGSTYFKKRVLLKTLFFTSIILILFGLYGYMISKGFEVDKYAPSENNILLSNEEKVTMRFLFFVSIISHLVLLSIGYFKLKEKEV